MRSALTLLVLLVLARTAAAQDEREQSKAHFVQGAKLYQAGDYDHAITEYETAYKILPIPEILFNLGQAYRLKGDKQKAIDLYNRYLLIAPNGRVADDAKSNVAELKSEIEAARLKAKADADAAAQRESERKARAERAAQEKAAAEKAAHEKAAAEKLAAEKAAADKAQAARDDAARREAERAAVAQPVPVLVTAPSEKPHQEPLYKRWWLWTAAGGVVAVALGVGLGVGLSRAPSAPTVSTSDGTLHPF